MTTTVLRLSAAIEVATGAALIAVPELVAQLLLGTGLSSAGIAVARLTGIALLCLGLACWPDAEDAGKPALRALFAYNLLAAVYLAYLRVGGGFVSYLLWPACALHFVLGFLLARPVWTTFSRTRSAQTKSH